MTTRRKDGQPNASTAAKKNPQVDQTNWRKRLQTSKIKFDDDAKEIFLREVAEKGLQIRAAHIAGVTGGCVNGHLKNDPDFAEAYNEALSSYQDKIGDEVRRRGKDGYEEPVFYKGARAVEPIIQEDGTLLENENGEVVMRFCTITKFSDRLLEMEAKRVNPEYRDKQTIDLNAEGGGVIVAPAGMDAEEAIALSEKENEEADRLHARRLKELEDARSG